MELIHSDLITITYPKNLIRCANTKKGQRYFSHSNLKYFTSCKCDLQHHYFFVKELLYYFIAFIFVLLKINVQALTV